MAAGIIDPTKVCFSTILEYEIILFLVISGMKSSLRSQASMALPKNILGMNAFNTSISLNRQVVRCCLEHAASVAKTFLMSDVVVVDIKEPESVPAGNPMDNSGLNPTTNKIQYACSNHIRFTIP